MAFLILLRYVLKCPFFIIIWGFFYQFLVGPPQLLSWLHQKLKEFVKKTEKSSRFVLLTAISLRKHATLVKLYEVINGIFCSYCNYVAFCFLSHPFTVAYICGFEQDTFLYEENVAFYNIEWV